MLSRTAGIVPFGRALLSFDMVVQWIDSQLARLPCVVTSTLIRFESAAAEEGIAVASVHSYLASILVMNLYVSGG